MHMLHYNIVVCKCNPGFDWMKAGNVSIFIRQQTCIQDSNGLMPTLQSFA
jgi:hypothetical protein